MAGSTNVQQTTSPVDGSVVAQRDLATPAQIDAMLDGAVAAQRSWRQVPLRERAEVIGRLVAWMVDRADDIGRELSWQMGRPVTHSPLELTRGFAERATWLAGAAAEALADTEVEPREGCRRFIRHEPVGVVLVVAPWNYPYLCSVNAVVPALLAGDAVVLKVSSQTPLVADRWSAGLAAAGLPDGVFHCVDADHDAVARIVADPRVGFVAFTGRWRVAMPCSARRQSALSAPGWSWAERTPPTCARTPRSRRPWPSWSMVCTSTRVSRAVRSSGSMYTATGSKSW